MFQKFLDARMQEFRCEARNSMSPQGNTGQQKDRNDKEFEEDVIQRKTDKITKQAETMKAQINDVAGMSVAQSNMQVNKCRMIERGQLVHSVFVDEDYEMLGGNVDEITYNKIINGEYIDFSKLLSKDRLSIEDNKHMEMINKKWPYILGTSE